MNKQGFTLIEVLTTVLIIGILAAVAMPQYSRAVERARATEAMTALKAMNDAIYAFYADKTICPERFTQLVVTLPDNSSAITPYIIQTKNFGFYLNSGLGVDIPGTGCEGVIAERINSGGKYNYYIWNPYTRGTTGKALALQCGALGGETLTDASKAVCESLGLYRETATTPS